jgi:hypothetical protein
MTLSIFKPDLRFLSTHQYVKTLLGYMLKCVASCIVPLMPDECRMSHAELAKISEIEPAYSRDIAT